MLEPMYKDIGVGAASNKVQDTYFTADFGTTTLDGGLGDGKMIVYPFDGQKNVRRQINSAEEEPNPVPGASIVGYPISVHADLVWTITTDSFTVVQHGSLTPLAVQLLTSATDSNTESHEAAIIPLAPLAANTTYDVHFVGKVNQTPIDRTWSFTTGG
jgi:hypothetical protein